jgi:hypothetical protein
MRRSDHAAAGGDRRDGKHRQHRSTGLTGVTGYVICGQ